MFWETPNHPINEWCVQHINLLPSQFSVSSPLTEANTPVWGTCPGLPGQIILNGPEDVASDVALDPMFTWDAGSNATSYPNPFNPVTIFAVELTGAGHTTLIVYDLHVRRVATLINEVQSGILYHIVYRLRPEP